MAKKKFYRYPLYIVARSAAFLFGLLPRKILMSLAQGLGTAAFYAVARQRNKTVRHLKRAWGTAKNDAEIQAMAKGVFQHMAMTAFELLKFPVLRHTDWQKWVDADQAYETYGALLKEGKGLISMTAHLGNWELLAGIFGLKHYSGAVLGRRIYYEPYNQWIVSLRRSVGIETIYRDDSSRQILKRLAANQIIGILPDQDIDSLKGVFVDFFGMPAYTPVAPVRLALASGAPLVTNFLVRRPDTGYQWVMGKVLRPAEDPDQKNAVLKYTELWMKEFEQMIRRYPEQWGWMHDRWKTTPERVQEKVKEVSVS